MFQQTTMFNQKPNRLEIFANLVKKQIENRIIRYSDTLTDCKYLGKPCFVVCSTDDSTFLFMKDKDYKGISAYLPNDFIYTSFNGNSYILVKDDTLKCLKFKYENLFNDLAIQETHVTLNGITFSLDI